MDSVALVYETGVGGRAMSAAGCWSVSVGVGSWVHVVWLKLRWEVTGAEWTGRQSGVRNE